MVKRGWKKKGVTLMLRLIKFYGAECKFCQQMEPLDKKLEDELGVKLEKLEVWHNEENARKLAGVDTFCGGVPFYLNTETTKALCGAVDFETLAAWAQGKPIVQPEHNHEDDEHDHKHHEH